MKKRMKVLFVAHSGDICGGANRILLDLMVNLRTRHGIVPGVLVPVSGCEMETACRNLGIDVYAAPYHSCCTVYQGEPKDVLRFLKLCFAPMVDWFKTGRIERLIPDDYDLVYTNDRIVIAGGYLAKRRGIAHIWHVRCFGRINQNRFPFHWNKMMERFSDRIPVISSALFRDLEENGVDRRKIRLIHDGIDMNRPMGKLRKDHTGMHLLLTGRIIPSKGHLDAICAIDTLVNRHQVDAQLYFAGEIPKYGNQEYMQCLNERIARAGLENRVHFLGETKDMDALRETMDVELMCSWCEAFGLVTVEGMRAGLPVVGSDMGGTVDIIQDGVSGLLYKAKEPEDLAEKLLWLYEHPQEMEKMGQMGRARAMEKFSIERCADDVYQLITEVSISRNEKKD